MPAFVFSEGDFVRSCLASHLWTAYLIRERGISEADALAEGRAINLMDDHRMGANGRQPVEDFLNRNLTGIKRPPL